MWQVDLSRSPINEKADLLIPFSSQYLVSAIGVVLECIMGLSRTHASLNAAHFAWVPLNIKVMIHCARNHWNSAMAKVSVIFLSFFLNPLYETEVSWERMSYTIDQYDTLAVETCTVDQCLNATVGNSVDSGKQEG